MFTLDEMQTKAAHLRDWAVALLVAHEREAHGGASCWPNRVSLLAYLAHNLGITGRGVGPALEQMRELLDEYDRTCTDLACRHKLN